MSLSKINWKHRGTILAIIITITSTTWAQQITWSENYQMQSIFNANEIIQATSEGFYVLQNYKNANYYYEQHVSFYNLDFEKRQTAQPLEFVDGNLKGRYEFSLSLKNLPYVAYSVDNVAKQKEVLYMNALKSSTLELENTPTKLLEIKYENKIKPKGGFSQ